MSLVDEVQQALELPQLDLIDGKRDPPYIGQYGLSNQLVNAIAHLVAIDGQFSRFLRCDQDAHLLVFDPAVDERLADELIPALYETASGSSIPLADLLYEHAYSAGAPIVELLYDTAGTRTLAQVLVAIETVLIDVYDGTNHYLKTHETA